MYSEGLNMHLFQSRVRKLKQEKNTSENDQKQLMEKIEEIRQT